jgi:hypothetical protein
MFTSFRATFDTGCTLGHYLDLLHSRTDQKLVLGKVSTIAFVLGKLNLSCTCMIVILTTTLEPELCSNPC